ncbi:Transcription initiation factor TFIID subunit 12 [Geranomyces michiganensis]|nr:Transcription initiation factor TFIID subunit 12 [Geranomyces michiganensis]
MVQTPGHPQYEQYMAALNYYMAQYASNAGQAAASASGSPASTPNGTPPGTPRLGSGATQGPVARPFVSAAQATPAGALNQGGPATATLNQQSSYSSPYTPMSVRIPPSHMPSRFDPRDLRAPGNLPILSKDRLRYIVAQLDPNFKLENDVEEMMLEIADDFITRVAEKACRLAKHRKSIRVTVRDARIPLEQDWSIRVPGFGTEPHERDDHGDAAAPPAGAFDSVEATASAAPDSETEKTRLHRARVQKVREAIRDGGRHRYAPSTISSAGGMSGVATQGPPTSISAVAGLPGTTAGGVKKAAKQRAPPKPKVS